MLFKYLLDQAQRAAGPVVLRRCLSKQSQRPSQGYKHYRLWAIPGMLVNQKDILAKQHKIYWHPGLNVGIDERRSIYALRDGIMVITEEEFNPDWDVDLVNEVYRNRSDGTKEAPTHMRYIHVIPKRPISEYKLVDVV